MTCRDVLAFLSDYLTGDLPRGTREVFVSHLDSCESCRAYLDSYQKTIALARTAAYDETPPPRELVEAILASLGKRA
ncbi:MAG TPA: zf-HC2 domain-containing protein [Thermoanaerobaculia bacterium]|nr:zf-HC2 domain-containing protein [Thermoanaerobaculia bacterium]